MNRVTFEIPGAPRPLERPRVTRRGIAFTPKRSVEAKAHVATLARAASVKPVAGPVQMVLSFIFPMPKKREPHHVDGFPCTKRPDLAHLIKLVKDALEGIAYYDDKQVVVIQAQKVWGEEGATVVTLERPDFLVPQPDDPTVH